MKTIDTKEISRRVKLFKNIDPKIYEQFIRLVDQRVTELTVAVTEAPPDQILVCQGRAQEARKMFQILTELPEDTSAPQQHPSQRPGP
jgi:hypothetical protein